MIERYRLENWGRWGRMDSDRPRVSCPVLYALGADGDPDGYADSIPDLLPPPIDIRDAEALDISIQKLSAGHRRVIRARYYLRRSVDIMDDLAARRALQDIIDQCPPPAGSPIGESKPGARAAVTLSEDERQPCEVWTRVMGYHRPVESFNVGKKQEHRQRRFFAEPKQIGIICNGKGAEG